MVFCQKLRRQKYQKCPEYQVYHKEQQVGSVQNRRLSVCVCGGSVKNGHVTKMYTSQSSRVIKLNS